MESDDPIRESPDKASTSTFTNPAAEMEYEWCSPGQRILQRRGKLVLLTDSRPVDAFDDPYEAKAPNKF